jgi:Protein of unknown function (DUF3667)
MTVTRVGVCANCGESLGGAFCPACGQKAASPDVSLHEFFHEAVEEFAHVDGKILETLRLLVTRPGALTREFLDGRRVRYISPLRVYLTCSVLFFALAAYVPQRGKPFFTVTKLTNHDADFDAATLAHMRAEATERANEAIVHSFPRAMFVLMPVFGLLTWGCYRRKRPFYAAHLYYSIHFHAFLFIALSVAVLLRARFGQNGLGIPLLAIAAYHFMSLRRVFGGSWFEHAWKGVVLWVVYSALVAVAVVVLGLATLRPAG